MEEIIPFQTKIIMPLKERDEQFMKIQELIQCKRNFLYNKQKNQELALLMRYRKKYRYK